MPGEVQLDGATWLTPVRIREGAAQTNVDLLKLSPLACFGHVFPDMPLKQARSKLGFTARFPDIIDNCLPHLDNHLENLLGTIPGGLT